MATETANGNNHVVAKMPPTPSPLRNFKFFQSNMRILVTGGAGFIGSPLVDKLMANEKNEVIVADNFFTSSKDNLRKWIGHPRFELIRHGRTLISNGLATDNKDKCDWHTEHVGACKASWSKDFIGINIRGVRSCYDERKNVAETLMFDYDRQHGIEIRNASIFKPHMNIDDGRVVSNFIAQALRGEPLTVQAPGTQT
ncbi:UDP-glucuronic acid decarboxylase [Musa troglodytarum]|uniref:UDP-glucuronic acid decarboxylase n=1 Tax=Musa troglodytarum TaxID=320322 RepID=A0A9E7GJJ3_9LILI|nr:UDP-glucuronic acid decarboxylase [Musa troglodytarum]